MAVDTILNTAVPLQTKPPAKIKQADAIHLQAKDNSRLSAMVASITTTEPAGSIGQADSEMVKQPPSELPDGIQPDQKSNILKSENKNGKLNNQENAKVKSEKLKETGSKNNLSKSNKTNVRSGVVVKNKENIKHIKVAKDNETNSNDNKAKENSGERISKNTKSLSGKWNTPQEAEVCSDESSIEYVTFDDYVDKLSNGKTPKQKCCFNRQDNDSSPLPPKPSSSSSSVSSISTININETQSPSLQDSILFDAKTLRNSLIEASEHPTHEILLQSLFKEKELTSGNVCAWSPSIDFKSNVPKLASKRSQFHHQQQQNVNPPSRIQTQRSLSSQKDDYDTNNNSFTVPAVYDRLARLGRFREFSFQHRPDDWGWYMKEYNATHTVGKVGVKRKKKQLRFGVDVPDPYATLGKRINNNSTTLDSRQNTFHQGDPVTSSVVSKERQPTKKKRGENETDADLSNSKSDETADGVKDRNYPVLAPTREANAALTNTGKGSKPDKAVAKATTTSDTKEKRHQKLNKTNNHSNHNQHHHNRSQQSQNHPHHPPHPGFPQLSGEDVKLTLVSSKILHQKDTNDNNDNNSDDDLDDDDEEDDEEEKLWQNPFPSPSRCVNSKTLRDAEDTRKEKSLDLSKDKSRSQKNKSKNENTVGTNQNIESNQYISFQPLEVNGKESKSKPSKSSLKKESGEKDSKKQSQHLKAELERENDGSLMVKISVFEKEEVKIKEDKDTEIDDRGGMDKNKKSVKICREESLLMGKELHEKLKRLNYSEMARVEINTSNNRIDEWNVKNNKRLVNKGLEINQMENSIGYKERKNVIRFSDNDEALELKGTVCKRKKPKSKSVLKEKNDADLCLGVGNGHLYPRHRTAYQEIEYVSNNKMLKSMPRIKYTKSKFDEKVEDQRVTQSLDSAVIPHDVKQGKGPVHQTLLIRSSTVHLTTELDSLENPDEIDAVAGRNVHQTYPLNDWKKTVDEGKCGFIVKSFPVDGHNRLNNKKNTETSDHETISTNQAEILRDKKKDLNTFLTTNPNDDDTLLKDENVFPLDDKNDNENHEYRINSVSLSMDNLNDSSLAATADNVEVEGKSSYSKSGKITLKKSRPLYRSKPELPSIKVSMDDHNIVRKEDTRSSSIKTFHFPPINNPESMSEKQNALDDLFVSGVNHDRSRPRDHSIISRKRPVSLDRGLIDDLVRYHSETSSIGFKNQQNLLPSLHTHHPASHHHHNHHNSFLTNNQFQQPFKQPQPEESPSLAPSVQKLNKIPSDVIRPRPDSPVDGRKMTSSTSTSSGKELPDSKRHVQIYAHVRKSHNTTLSQHTPSNSSSEKSPMQNKQQQPPLPDLQHLLGFNKLS